MLSKTALHGGHDSSRQGRSVESGMTLEGATARMGCRCVVTAFGEGFTGRECVGELGPEWMAFLGAEWLLCFGVAFAAVQPSSRRRPGQASLDTRRLEGVVCHHPWQPSTA